MNRNWFLWLPLALGVMLFVMFWLGLVNPSDRVIASNMVGQNLPKFETPAAIPDRPGLATSDFSDGKPRLLNIFASWCVPCLREIPVLKRLQAQGVDIAGIAVHDSSPALAQFLAQNGNPYSRIGLDQAGRAQIAFGSSGVPETFVIDGQGKIIHQYVGVVSEADIPVILETLGAQE